MRLEKYCKKNKYFSYYILAFILPIILMGAIYIFTHIYPFGNKTLLIGDMFGQYLGLLTEMRDIILGDGNLMYSFSKSLGGGMIGVFAYYLASPLNLILVLFPKEYITEAIVAITLIKLGLCGLTCCVFLNKTYNKNDFSLVAFSCCYSLMSYNLIFQQNIMWLDGVIVLPLVLLGINNIIKENKFVLYTISLFLAIYTNYYIGYMICIFSVIYFIYKLFNNEDIYNKIATIKSKIKYFISSSIIAGGLSAFLLIPTLVSLKNGKAEVELLRTTLGLDLNITDILSRLLFGSFIRKDMIRDTMPHIYCGVIILVLVISYFFINNISKRKKISTFVVICIMISSFCINILNIVWHGFDSPNGFLYRNSFIFSFFLIIVAYESFINLKYLKNKYLLVILGLVAADGIVSNLLGYEFLSLNKIAISILLAIIYCVIIYLYNSNKIKSVLSLFIICIVVIGEIFLNAYITTPNLPYYPRAYLNKYLSDIEPIINKYKSKDNDFYRIEKTINYSSNEPLLLNYRGIDHSSSANESNLAKIVNDLGITTGSGVTELYNHGSTIIADSLLGLKYVIAHDNIEGTTMNLEYTKNKYYNLVEKIDGFNIYENPYNLPIGFMVNKEIENINSNNINLFDFQRDILNSMITKTEDQEYYTRFYKSNIKLNNVKKDSFEGSNRYTKIDKNNDGSIEINVKAPNEDILYMYLPCKLFGSEKLKVSNTIHIYVNGEKYTAYYAENYSIVALGSFKKGEDISIKLELFDNQVCIDDFQFYSLDVDKFEKAYSELRKGKLDIIDYYDGYLNGKVNVDKDKTVLYTSIPYDDGWSVSVDGKEVEPVKLLDSVMGVELSEGEHNIVFKYRTPGLVVGIGVSCVSVIVFVYMIYRNRNKNLNI